MKNNVYSLKSFKISSDTERSIQKVKIRKEKMYAPDFKLFSQFCKENQLEINFESMEYYLHQSITVQQVRLSTFNRRAAGVKYWLTNNYKMKQTLEQEERIRVLRQMYNEEEYLRLKPMRGIRAENQNDVLRLIEKYDTNKKADIRKRAICLVNLITANRPSEMVRLKISDFDLPNRSIWVMLKKQGEMKEKRLTLECIQAVKKYIAICGLQQEDYFVGAADKWGNHTSRQISEISYNQSIHAWLGFAPYTFRKTQITAMYNKGADIPTIAKQSGHKSQQTIMEHYINLKTSDVDEYL